MNDLTELIFILDRSGSMGGLEKDTIGGFNSLIEKQKAEEGRALVSTVLFDHICETLHDRIDLQKVEPMTRKQYYVRGTTALLDAIGETVDRITIAQKYAREEDKPGKTMVVITTDGLENASKKYSKEEINRLITKKQKEEDWEFLFLGANIDAIEVASHFGIRKENAANFIADERGLNMIYAGVAQAVTSKRRRGFVESCWKADIEKDFENKNRE